MITALSRMIVGEALPDSSNVYCVAASNGQDFTYTVVTKPQSQSAGGDSKENGVCEASSGSNILTMHPP